VIGSDYARWTCPVCQETVTAGPRMRTPESWLRAVQRRHGDKHGGRLRQWAKEAVETDSV
jgi:hypothetical protein